MNRIVALATFAAMVACAGGSSMSNPSPDAGKDPRVGLKGGLQNAAEAVSNLKVVAKAPSPAGFDSAWNSDITFLGNYAIQGSFNGFEVWDVSNPAAPTIVTAHTCPASQNDVSVFRNLLFMSVESNNVDLDCTGPAVTDTVSPRRMRGIRIFDISDIRRPRHIANVQTCRGSHTHTVLEDPRDRENVYIYVSGSSTMRSPRELSGCIRERPDSNPNSAYWRIEVIKVPLANPASAAVVNRANIFSGLVQPATHGQAIADIDNERRALDSTRKVGGFIAVSPTTGKEMALGRRFLGSQLDSLVNVRGGTGEPTRADTMMLRNNLQVIVDRVYGTSSSPRPGIDPISTNRQCHDITVYPAVGLAGGACGGHGLLLDISDPVNPRRIGEVSDSNFAFWHSATFNNDGTKILFTDEWGGGTQPKCRATDKKEWGADAIFDIVNGKMEFRSYYKIAAPQTETENCVAHNGSMLPIPGRDVMVQGWYQGGISVFDFTDSRHPVEIAYHDRGPIDPTRLVTGGSWSAYWYNGTIASSEIARGLDNFQLIPSQYVTQNEIDAANTVKMTYLNAQGQPKYVWPPSFPLARAYLDQLERSKCLPAGRIADARRSLADAEKAAGAARRDALQALARSLDADMASSCDQSKLKKLQSAVQDLSAPVVP